MREQLRSARQELQLSEKRKNCVSENTNLLKEKNESGSYCNSYLDHHLVKNIQEFINNGCTTKNFLRGKINIAGMGVHSIERKFTEVHFKDFKPRARCSELHARYGT